MGAGVAYQYDHHIILDLYQLYEDALPEDFDKNAEDAHWEQADLESDAYDWFQNLVLECFNAWAIRRLDPDKHNTLLIGETDRLYIGIDATGADGSPCFYLKPKTYRRWERYKPEYEPEWMDYDYILNADAKRGFNRLIKRAPGLIRFWTSGYTSSKYGSQSDGNYIEYSRTQEKTP